MALDRADLVHALRLADPALSRFDPLARIIAFDDFDRGFCGWTQLVGNYEHSLDTMLPGYAQHTQPMLSTLATWDFGSHGSFDGSYALKLATKPRAGTQNVTIKRLTFRKRGPVRLEFYFTFKPEANELRLSETDVRSIGFLYDLQTGDADADSWRVMPHLRFLNADGGRHLQRWQFKRRTTDVMPIGTENKSCEGVGEVREIAAGPHHQVGPVAGFEHADIVPPEATSAALRREAERIRRHEHIGAARTLSSGVERLPELGLQSPGLVGRRPVHAEPYGHPSGLEVDHAAHPGAEPRVAGRAVRHPGPGGPEPSHLGVVEVDPVRHPHVAVDPPEVVEQIHGTPAESLEHVAFLIDRLGQVGVEPEAVAAGERRRLAHELGRDAERAARRDRHDDALAVVVPRDHRFGRGQDRVDVLDDVVGRETAA